MLLSPASCHEQLTSLLSQDIGPHTALLATPHGQLVCCSSKERPDEQEGESTAEPWLDEPERIRLLLGLLSQWEQEESPRIECEVCLMPVSTHTFLMTSSARQALRAISTSPSRGKHVRKRQYAASTITSSGSLRSAC